MDKKHVLEDAACEIPKSPRLGVTGDAKTVARALGNPMGTPMSDTDDLRITKIRPLLPPACLIEDYPCTPEVGDFVHKSRTQVQKIMQGVDDRLLVIVGPCSVHDPSAALEYAARLKAFADSKGLWKNLFIVMRVYFEKPRTTVGWKGLINDPNLDGSFQINKGLRMARSLLLEINTMGLSAGTEFLDTISPQFIADLVAWGAIGARTTESQCHRELASGLSMPIGFKNGTGGDVQVAVDAIKAAAGAHSFLSISKQSVACIVQTCGNKDCHIILRGGSDGPNYSDEHVRSVRATCKKSGVCEPLMVDCSHGNSCKDHTRQPIVAADIAKRIAAGSRDVFGVMLESFLMAGAQKFVAGSGQKLTYGMSITDKCMDWGTTEGVLMGLAEAVEARRAL